MMSTSSGGSFIPKRSTGKVSPVRAGKRIYVFSYIAYVLFFGTLLSVIGIYFLHSQAEARLQEYVALVDTERQAFEQQSEIAAIRTLDEQLQTAEQILDWHLAPSVIFDALEDVIVNAVQVNSFAYTRVTGSPAQVTFTGHTGSFDALLFQREIMSQSSLFASADITDVQYGVEQQEGSEDSRVVVPIESVSVTFMLDDPETQSEIRYRPRSFDRAVVQEEIAEGEPVTDDTEAVTSEDETSPDESAVPEDPDEDPDEEISTETTP